MRKLVFAALATAVALGAAAPAFAQEGRYEGRTVKKVVIHRDHGRHEGWRHSRHYGASKKVVIKHGQGKTVIKKRVEG
jgi:hypothetical protein